METIKYIIVDDEPAAHKVLGILLKKYESLECTANCYNAFKAIEFLNENKPDIMFLDMDMPDMNGMELLKNIKQPIKVIITTAHSGYAIQGYEFGVVDFLLKPIKAERLFKTMTHIFDIFKTMAIPAGKEIAITNVENGPYIMATPDKKEYVKVYCSTILFIEKKENYSYIHTTSGENFYKLCTLKEIFAELGEGFVYANKCIIIATDKAESPDDKTVLINDRTGYKISQLVQEKNNKKTGFSGSKTDV